MVKVDKKEQAKFTWAAQNMAGHTNYPTVIQWLAIAPAPKKLVADESKQQSSNTGEPPKAA